jgi:hypothetical protein
MIAMEQHRWDNDEVLMNDLVEALREIAPLSERVAQQAKGALVWRTVDDELLLATLSFDSSLERSDLTRDREGGARILVFNSEPLTVELEVQSDRIVGQLVPPGMGEIRLETADGRSVRVATDDLGFFVLSPVPVGGIRLHCDTPTTRLVTDWFQP